MRCVCRTIGQPLRAASASPAAAAMATTAEAAATTAVAGAASTAATTTAGMADPALASKFCLGHVDDSDYDSHRAVQYKQRKYLTVDSRRANSAQQQPQTRTSLPKHGTSRIAPDAVRTRRHHHTSKRAARPSLGYKPTLRRLDEVEITVVSAEWQSSDNDAESTLDHTYGAAEASEQQQRPDETTTSNHTQRGYCCDIGVTGKFRGAEAWLGKPTADGFDAVPIVQEAERSRLFLFTDSDAPIPSRLGRF